MSLAYLTTCFGSLSHTFIRRELRGFEGRGVAVDLFGVRRDPQIADDAGDLVARTAYLYPLPLMRILLQNLRCALLRPVRYWRCVADCLYSPGDNARQRLLLVYHLLISTALADALAKRKVSHLHIHFLNVAASVGMFAARLNGTPYSITVHSAGEDLLPHVAGLRLKLRHADRLLMISRFNVDYYDRIEPCRDKAHVLRCGIDLSAYPYEPRTAPRQPLQVLAVGRLVEKKGFRYLVEAAEALRRSRPDVHIEILGSGPLQAALQQQIDTAGLAGMVELAGRVAPDEARNRMADADLLVVPSVTSGSGEMEGLPVVIMEAMALGVPVIASRHAGIPELVHCGDTGALVPEHDAAALAGAIAAFQPDADQLRRARQLIEQECDIAQLVQRRLELLGGS